MFKLINNLPNDFHLGPPENYGSLENWLKDVSKMKEKLDSIARDNKIGREKENLEKNIDRLNYLEANEAKKWFARFKPVHCNNTKKILTCLTEEPLSGMQGGAISDVAITDPVELKTKSQHFWVICIK